MIFLFMTIFFRIKLLFLQENTQLGYIIKVRQRCDQYHKKYVLMTVSS